MIRYRFHSFKIPRKNYTSGEGKSWEYGEGGRMRYTIVGNMPSMSSPLGIYARVAATRNVTKAFWDRINALKADWRGLQRAAEYLHENTERIPPMVPVSNEQKEVHLRDTWFMETMIAPAGLNMEMGYSAPYAVYVHEMTSPPYGDVKWTRPGSGPQWFMKALQRDKPVMLEIIARYARRNI